MKGLGLVIVDDNKGFVDLPFNVEQQMRIVVYPYKTQTSEGTVKPNTLAVLYNAGVFV